MRFNAAAPVPFDILAVRNMGPNVFEFEFTKPLAASLGADVSANLTVQTWWDRISETYGCCRRNASNADGVTTVTGYSATVQANRAKVTVTFPAALSQYWIYYMRWTDAMRSETNETLYGTEAWYTLNSFGPGTTASVDGRRPGTPDAPFTLSRTANGGLRLRLSLPNRESYRVIAADLRGRTLAVRQGRGAGEVSFNASELSEGITALRIQAGGRNYTRLISR
jgi:hypothetical protein